MVRGKTRTRDVGGTPELTGRLTELAAFKVHEAEIVVARRRVRMVFAEYAQAHRERGFMSRARRVQILVNLIEVAEVIERGRKVGVVTLPSGLLNRQRLFKQGARALQARILLTGAAPWVGEAFCAARLGGDHGIAYGTIGAPLDVAALIERAAVHHSPA